MNYLGIKIIVLVSILKLTCGRIIFEDDFTEFNSSKWEVYGSNMKCSSKWILDYQYEKW